MATCRGARFVEAQLASIACQTRPPDELIINDDASDDRTLDIAREFSARAGFEVAIARNDVRLGITGNFERALSRCTGDVVFFADQDDVWAPRKIETLTRVLAERPDIGAVFHDGEVVSDDLTPLGASLWDALGFDDREQRKVEAGRAAEVFLRHVVAAGTSMAFRAEYLPLALPFPELRSCHDAFTAFVVSAVAGVALVREPLIQYRLHGENQIGIRKLGLREQLEKAREQIATGAFAYAEEFFTVAQERLLSSSYTVPRATLHGIEQKIRHARRRNEMSRSLLGRLGTIARETATGRYWRYSYGIKSVAQDLWLR